MTHYLIRVKGKTTGFIYIRKGTGNYHLRKNATVFATKAEAELYIKRYILGFGGSPKVIVPTTKPVGTPRYDPRY